MAKPRQRKIQRIHAKMSPVTSTSNRAGDNSKATNNGTSVAPKSQQTSIMWCCAVAVAILAAIAVSISSFKGRQGVPALQIKPSAASECAELCCISWS